MRSSFREESLNSHAVIDILELLPLIDEGLVITTKDGSEKAHTLANCRSRTPKIVHEISEDVVRVVEFICD